VKRQKPGLIELNLVHPKYDPYEIYGIIPKDLSKPYDMYEVLARIVDDSEIDEYKAGYGKTLICAYARIDGWAVGIVANQRSIVKLSSGKCKLGVSFIQIAQIKQRDL
jgi:3-methylcrotonyl-CoA carboxylase beta subunit